MANTSFPKGMEKLLSGQINVMTDSLKVALISDAYIYSASHEYLSHLGPRIGTDQALTNVTLAGGVLDADDLDFGALAPGNIVKAFVVYKDTGNAATSPVLLHYDTQIGLPFATNGGALTVPWDDAARRIARIAGPFYPKAAELLWSGGLNLASATLAVVGVPAGYAMDSAHEFLADVGTLVGGPVALSSKTVTNGVFDADDVDMGALAAGSNLGGVVIFVNTGDAATSRLVLKPSTITGFPLLTNGSNVTVRWSGGAARIVSLVPA